MQRERRIPRASNRGPRFRLHLAVCGISLTGVGTASERRTRGYLDDGRRNAGRGTGRHLKTNLPMWGVFLHKAEDEAVLQCEVSEGLLVRQELPPGRRKGQTESAAREERTAGLDRL